MIKDASHSFINHCSVVSTELNKTTMSEERIGSGRLESLEHLKLDAADLLKACQVVPTNII